MQSDEASAATTVPSDRYRILTELGLGGMAHVYLAVSRGPAGFNKLVVLKILKQDLASIPALHDSFLREARVSARMSHPNVVAVNEVEERGGVPIIVMEYLQGQPFSAIMRRMLGRAPLDVPLHILAEALRGLHYAHELTDFDGTSLQLVHRDFTPQNIFVTYDGVPKVLDFGIAQIARFDNGSPSSVVKGKLRYMSPEQMFGLPLDRRTDVFAAGIVLCETVTGQRFWGSLTDAEVAEKVAHGDIPTPNDFTSSCPPQLQHICARALAIDRDQRYPTVAEMQQDLETFLTSRSAPITTQDLGRQVTQWFSAERRQAQQLIETNLSNDALVSWPNASDNAPDARTSRTPPGTTTETTPEAPWRLQAPATAQGGGRRRLAKRLAQALAVSILFGGALLLRAPRERASAAVVASVPTPTTPKAAQVSVTAFPSSATLLLDGIPVGQNPFVKEFAVDHTWHELRIQAPGYETVEQRVQFSQDVEVVVHLKTETPARPTTSPPPARATSSATTRVARVPRSPPPPRASCSPPYTYDQRGLKHFKPECL